MVSFDFQHFIVTRTWVTFFFLSSLFSHKISAKVIIICILIHTSTTCLLHLFAGFDHGKGNGGASTVKVAALRSSKSLTPASSFDKISSVSAFRNLSAEKENRRSISRKADMAPIQTLAIRPVPRVDKASLIGTRNGGSVHEQKSTSSVPRRRSSSPSDFS